MRLDLFQHVVKILKLARPDAACQRCFSVDKDRVLNEVFNDSFPAV
jgi:hypothetical protein